MRAAGALASIVLERHLQRVAANHSVTISKEEATIRDLNDPLKLNKAYDFATWRKIQLLGDLRHLCSTQRNGEPAKEQVEDLIAGVSSVIKSVF